MYNLLLRDLFERSKFQRTRVDSEQLKISDEQISEPLKRDSKAVDSMSLNELRSELSKCKEVCEFFYFLHFFFKLVN
jgi:hypothetical protein